MMVNNEYKMQKGILFSAIFLSLLSLSGCNDESYESNLNTLPPLPEMNGHVFAENNNQQGLLNSEVTININDHVRSTTGSDIKLKNVTLQNNSTCKVNSIQSLSFSVQTGDVDDCLFEYEVQSKLYDEINTTTAIVRLAVGETYQNEALPRITKKTTLNNPISIDLKYELLNEGIDPDDDLNTELTIIGSGEATIANENTVVFEPNNVGTAEIFYSYKSSSNVKQGVISVSVSEEGENTPPAVTDFEQEGLINLEDTVVIDVSGYVEDINGDDIQLVSIDDFNSSSSLFAPTDINNTQFYFNASVPGSHDVAYTVSDHMGGYSTGIVHINVEPDFSLIQDWKDIVSYDPIIDSDIRFFAPMTKVYADYINANYTGTVVEDGSYGETDSEIVTMTLDQARGYCKTRGGRLPLTRELNTLFTTEGNVYSEHNWPTSQAYWTADKASEQDASTLYLYNGVLSSIDKESVSYVTCVDLSNKAVKDFSSSVSFLNNERNKYTYEITVIDPDANEASYQDIELISKNGYGVFDNSLSNMLAEVDTNGKGVFSYYDTSFISAVISINTSSNVNRFAFVPNLSSTDLDVTEPSNWNFVDIRYGKSEDLPAINDDGIPLLFEWQYSGLGTSAVYKESFVGQDFVIGLHLVNSGTFNRGSASFFLEQVGNVPDNTWYDESRAQPGAPQTDNSYNIVTHYFNSEYYLYQGHDNLVGVQEAEINRTHIYLWFQKKGDYLYYYSSDDAVRPDDPEFVIPFEWGSIDPSLPFWVGVGGSTDYSDVDVKAVSANFAAYL